MKKKIVLCMLAWNLALGTVTGAAEMVSAHGVEETYENIKKGSAYVICGGGMEYDTSEFCEGNYRFKYLDAGTVEIISYLGGEEDTEITIPSKAHGKNVTKIHEKAFLDSRYLKSVAIPDSITTIEAYAFQGCTAISHVELPTTISSVGRAAFQDTIWFQNLQKENPLVIVNNIVLNGRNVSGEITLPAGVRVIADYAFAWNTNLTGISISEGVTSIGAYTFYECSGLTNIKIPNTVTSIEECAFADSGLVSVELSNAINEISYAMFANCKMLTSVTVPSRVTKIGMIAFIGCSSLTEVVIPSGVTEIKDSAFEGCSSLTEVVIPSGVTEIGYSAFKGCSSLTEVVIPSGVTEIGLSAFEGCSKLTNVTIQSGVTVIGSSAFSGCSELMSITIPSSVIYIWSSAFKDCNKLRDVYYEGNSFQWHEILKVSCNNNNKYLKQATIHCGKEQELAITLKEKMVEEPLTVKTGNDLQFGTILRSDNYQKENVKVSWTSSNNKIATVFEWGQVYVKKKGTVEITATTMDGTSKTIKLKAVDYFKVNKISVEGKKTMKPKSTQKLKVTIAPANADNQELTWKSSDKKIATVNKKGKVKAKKKGTVKITAKATDGSKTKAVFKIKVK